MEKTFSIGCLDCKNRLWIGQKGHIYQTPENRQNLQKFLFDHTYHKLKFGSTETLDQVDGCKEIIYDADQKTN